MRVVIDVSVLVRVVLGSPAVARCLARLAQPGTTVLTSSLLLDEFLRTVRKPRLSHRVDVDLCLTTELFLTQVAEEIELTEPFPECPD